MSRAAAVTFLLILFAVAATPQALTITTTAFPDGFSGLPYTAGAGATGGTPPYAWVATGGLPAGLTLDAGGNLTGTPTATGTFTIGLQVTDSATPTPAVVTGSASLNILAALSVATTTLPLGTVGANYAATLQGQGGAPPYNWSAAGLPAGITLTGNQLGGVPTGAGTTNVQFTLSDNVGATAQATLPLTVEVPPSITTSSLPNGLLGTSYLVTLAASGGVPPYAWSATGLPAGITLSGNQLTGTPTALGSSSVQITVRDANLAAAQVTLGLTVGSSLSITTTSLPGGTVGASYTAPLAASGGTTPYTWSATGLPAGIAVNGSQLTGTPTAAGSSNVQLTVTDNVGATAQTTLTLAVIAPLSITTASLPGGTVGTSYSASLAASGGTPPYTWTANGLPPGITLSGSQLTGTPTTNSNYSVSVQVKDSNNLTDSKSLSIVISNALAITTSSLPGGVVGAVYSASLGATGGTSPYTWSATGLPPGVTLNTSSGALNGTPTTAGSYTVAVQVHDSATGQASKSFPVSVVSGLAITTASLPAGKTGTAYSATLAAAGGTSPYTWSVISGSLPAGLTLNTSSGAISGTPSSSGTSNFTVQAADSGGLSTSKGFSISISTPPPALLLGGSLAGGFAGTAYSQTLAATGGTPPYTYSISSGSLPPGLALNSGSGTISGTPTQAGTFSFTARVTDNASASATHAFSISISAGLSIVTVTLATGGIGDSYLQNLSAAGGVPPYSWQLATGSLPAGLILSASGTISGTPSTGGTFNIRVQVRDSAGTTATRDYVLTITSNLRITSTSPLPSGAVNAFYSQALAAISGAAPYRWSISAGSLPPGILLNSSTGVLSGQATRTGVYTFTVTVTDATQATASEEFSLTIVGGLAVSTTSLPGGSVNAPYSQTLAAVAGTSPYSWSITTGTLPSGLTLNSSTGAITGTPVAAGTSSFRVQVRDTLGATATQNLSIVIGAALAITSGPSLPSGSLGAAYSQSLAAAGGSPPYTWAVTSGSLPGGLTMSAAGVITGTANAAGPFNFTVRVTDSANTTASAPLSLAISAQALPVVTFPGMASTAAPLEQPSVAISLSKGYPVALQGQLTLGFAPDASVPADDPSIQFSTGGRTVNFTIAANATTAVFPASTLQFQTGSVAGTISLTVKLTAGGADVTPSPAPSHSVTIARSAPVVRSVRLVSTAGGFEVWITGYSTTRELTQANVTFHAAAGADLRTTQLTVPLTDAARQWYQDAGSKQYGSQFTIVEPFTVQGNASAVSSATATLTNSVGTSQ